MMGDTPESLYSTSFEQRAVSDDDKESFDIFETSIENNFEVGRVIIKAMLSGELSKG